MANNLRLSASAPVFVPSNRLNASLTSRTVSNRGVGCTINRSNAPDLSQNTSSDGNAFLKASRAAEIKSLGCSIVLQLDLEGKFPFQDPEWINSTIDKVSGLITISFITHV